MTLKNAQQTPTGTAYSRAGRLADRPQPSNDQTSPQGLNASKPENQNKCMSCITAPLNWESAYSGSAATVSTVIAAREQKPRSASAPLDRAITRSVSAACG